MTARFYLRLMAGLVVGSFVTANCQATSPKASPLAAAEQELMQGNVNSAIPELQTLTAANPRDGRAQLLLCRAFYAEQLADEAVTACEAATSLTGDDSVAQDWMGRAYGLKADRSGPLGGYKLASKVRLAFEASVNLNAHNGDAVSDLGEYYVNAPTILGGGFDRATELADRVVAFLPQQAHHIRGMAAEKNHDLVTAEQEFRAAVGAGGQPAAWTDLGHFYAHGDEKEKAVDALRHAVAADRSHDASLLDVAAILLKMHQEPELAMQAVRLYLTSSSQSDAAPTFKAHVVLGDLLKAGGDKAAARSEYDKALALARDYVPAQKAIQRL